METLKLKGRFVAVVFGPDGSEKQRVEGDNTITTNGKEALARYLYSAVTSGANPFKYIGVGTGTGSESAADTTLGTEVSRHTGTVSYSSGAIYQVTATFATNSAAGAITEYGLFTSNAVGTMFSRDVESVINVSATDTLTVTYQLTLS